jgi:hypothetical protein
MSRPSSEATKLAIPPGTVLDPDSPLRPKIVRSSLLHAHQFHSGAPWAEEYEKETLAIGSNRLPYQGKSTFDSRSLIEDAIAKADSLPALVSYNGNLLVFVEFGHEVGFDATRRRRTSLATVVMTPRSELLSVYPGLPQPPVKKRGNKNSAGT